MTPRAPGRCRAWSSVSSSVYSRPGVGRRSERSAGCHSTGSLRPTSGEEEWMMNTITEYTTSLIGQAAVALLAAYALTTIHHVYGGVVDKAPNRLLVPVILAPFIV